MREDLGEGGKDLSEGSQSKSSDDGEVEGKITLQTYVHFWVHRLTQLRPTSVRYRTVLVQTPTLAGYGTKAGPHSFSN